MSREFSKNTIYGPGNESRRQSFPLDVGKKLITTI
jgi:hypothetical protein